jgi:tetratricopeptide (TPR) repeat protein
MRRAFECVLSLGLLGCAQHSTELPVEQDLLCSDPSIDRRADIDQVWSSDAEARVRAGIVEVGGGYGELVAERTVTQIDKLAHEWVRMHEDVCQAALVTETLTQEDYGQVGVCLRIQLAQLQALIDIAQAPSRSQIDLFYYTITEIGQLIQLCDKPAAYEFYDEREQTLAVGRELAKSQVELSLEDLAAAEASLERALKLFDDDTDLPAGMLNDLRIHQGWLAREMHDYAAAQRSAESALALAEAAGLDLGVGNAHTTLASISTETRDFADALEHLHEADASYERALGKYSNYGAGAQNQYGSVYEEMREHKQAISHHKRAIAIYERVYGREHPYTAIAYTSLGTSYDNASEYDLALHAYVLALSINLRLLGSHPNTADVYNDLGVVHANLDQHVEALDYLHKALAIYELAYGHQHASVANTYRNIGFSEEAGGRHKEALEHYREALTIQQAVLSNDDPEIADVHVLIGQLHFAEGRYGEALEHYRKALAIQEPVLGNDDLETAATYAAIGNVFHHQGEYDRALEYFYKALAIEEPELGSDDVSVGVLYNNIGLAHHAAGEHGKALDCYRKALATSKRVLGSRHRETKITRENLAQLCKEYKPACGG